MMQNISRMMHGICFITGYGPDHSCGEFPAVLDGQIEYRDIYAFVKCNKGYELKGDGTFKCDQHSGSKWSPGTRPTCQQKGTMQNDFF